MGRKMKAVASAFAALSLMAVSGCSGSESVSSVVDGNPEVSGTVIWYSSHAPDQNERVTAAFAEEYPDVDLQILRLVTGELSVRYAQERGADTPSADVITLADGAMIASGLEKDWWETDVSTAEGFPAESINDGVMVAGILPMIAAINTDLVPEGEEPNSWEDFLSPEYKDQIILADPRNVPSYLAMAQLWTQEYGDDYLEKLADQNPQLVGSTVPGNEALGAGAAKVVFPNSAPGILSVIDAGAPVKMLDIAPTTGSEFYTVIASNAQNADGAAAFYEFLSTKEGQEAFNGKTISVREDADTGDLPEGFIPLNEILPEAEERRAELLGLLGVE
ncbi:extracellular solute-binding protein [Citricoccus sp. NPDC055426]|uniref:ABC transporter substrate-binding protein n=1 Tax=Citricoccus sp. NPDC055426 TaxID=3155536 RepID=UPI00341E30E9